MIALIRSYIILGPFILNSSMNIETDIINDEKLPEESLKLNLPLKGLHK
jgi:hypothetical protein